MAHDNKKFSGEAKIQMTKHSTHFQIEVHCSLSRKHSFDSHQKVHVTVHGSNRRTHRGWLTGSEQSAAAEPYLVTTMPSQGYEEETLERGGYSQGMLNISWAGRHTA